jgi:hypothetical protein
MRGNSLALWERVRVRAANAPMSRPHPRCARPLPEGEVIRAGGVIRMGEVNSMAATV